MEKAIRLVMCADKSISIIVNNEEKHRIDVQNRCVSADKIYEIMEFAIGDHYSISSENELGIDNEVLEFFTSLLTDITEKVNAIAGNKDSATI